VNPGVNSPEILYAVPRAGVFIDKDPGAQRAEKIVEAGSGSKK